jgi:hypothetical protein
MSHQSYTLSLKLQQAFLFIQQNGSPELPVSMTSVAIHLKVSKRDVRSIVASLRLIGCPVVNSYDRRFGGYWIPTTGEQVETWKQKSLNRIRRSARLVHIASRYQPELPHMEEG